MLQRLVVPLLAVAIGLIVAAPALAQEPLVKVATDPTLGPILVDSKGIINHHYIRKNCRVQVNVLCCFTNCIIQCDTAILHGNDQFIFFVVSITDYKPGK